MRILFLSRWFPFPLNNGSKLRVYNLLRGLAVQHEVDLLAFADQPNIDTSAPKLTSLCRDIQTVPWKPFKPSSLRALIGFLDSSPRSVRDTFSAEMAQKIQLAIQGKPYDCIISSQVDCAAYYWYFGGLPALFEEVEVGVSYGMLAQSRGVLKRFQSGLRWKKQRSYLTRLLKKFQACTVVSTLERELLHTAVPTHPRVEVIPNCVDISDYNSVLESVEPNNIIFTGSFRFQPNFDAMVWFITQVYPRVQVQIPEVRLTITGDDAGKTLPAAANVLRTGFVEDVRPVIARAAVSIAPIFTGGGTRLKILEAMALRTPVVSTTKGAEGLDIEHGRHLLIADTAEVFADAVLSLLRDAQFRQGLAERAYQLVTEKYDWAAVMPLFLNVVHDSVHTSQLSSH